MGESMIGFGSYDYTYDSGWSGSAFRSGFSPRKAALSLYGLPAEESPRPSSGPGPASTAGAPPAPM